LGLAGDSGGYIYITNGKFTHPISVFCFKSCYIFFIW